jgi:cytidylate kinase
MSASATELKIHCQNTGNMYRSIAAYNVLRLAQLQSEASVADTSQKEHTTLNHQILSNCIDAIF